MFHRVDLKIRFCLHSNYSIPLAKCRGRGLLKNNFQRVPTYHKISRGGSGNYMVCRQITNIILKLISHIPSLPYTSRLETELILPRHSRKNLSVPSAMTSYFLLIFLFSHIIHVYTAPSEACFSSSMHVLFPSTYSSSSF